MRVVCAGIHRSGSTWLYNVARVIFIQQCKTTYGCFSSQYDPQNKCEIHVVKTHVFKKELLDSHFIFTTIRDLRDIAASAIRRELLENKATKIIEYLDTIVHKEHKPWKPFSNLEIIYEQLIQDKPKHISKIAKIMNQNIDPINIHQVVENLEIKTKFNPITQLHPNHITDGRKGSYRYVLSRPTILEINDRYKDWLIKNNYLETFF